MEIADNKPILSQVSDYCRRQILDGIWRPGEFIVSTKELSLRLGVNPRTVMKAYDELAAAQIIINKRGQGYLLAADARERLIELLRDEFEHRVVPELVKKMQMCGLTPDNVYKMIIDGTNILPSD